MSRRNRQAPFIVRFTEQLVNRYMIMSGDIVLMHRDGMESDLWRTVSREIARLSPEELGRLASDGRGWFDSSDPRRTSLYSVHSGTWVSKYDSGLELLQAIATTAVIARLMDRYPEG